jgi:hypothetical protein
MAILTNLPPVGDGLTMRRSTAADADALATFYSMIFCNRETRQPNPYVADWARDLASGAHPTFGADDYFMVVETGTGRIVSALNLISQTWTYAGIPFGVGRVELVGTLPEYRNRGLVRKLFNALHAESAARGEVAQAITGIPYFYRQFGYEMTVDLDCNRYLSKASAPKLKEGQPEPFRIRPAAESDVPYIAQLYEQACGRYLLACPRDARIWAYEFKGRTGKNFNKRAMFIIESAEGAPAGYLMHRPVLTGPTLWVHQVEVADGQSWAAVAPSLMRYLRQTGEAFQAQGLRTPDNQDDFSLIGLGMGVEHPVYDALGDRLPPAPPAGAYAWYIRVPDLPGFLRRIAPVLERRLAGSAMANHTGELKISFYRRGLRLAFERGRLAAVEAWQPTPDQEGDVAFPDLTFLHLVFGHRSLREIRHVFPDCWWANDDARLLLDILFPKQRSDIWPVA